MSWRRTHTAGLAGFIVVILAVGLLSPRLASAAQGLGAWRLGTWLLIMALLGGSFVLIGHGVSGLLRGCLIDNRNRLSLSKLQLFLWTALVLSAFLTLAAFRVHAGEADPLDIGVPTEVWALLGISTASSVGSAAVKYAKRNASVDTTATDTALDRTRAAMPQEDPGNLGREGLLVTRATPQDSRVSDLFTGDEVGSAAQLELGKVQMFFFTLVVVFAYGIAVGGGFYSAGGVPKALPDLSEGMVVLLLISHAGFLGAKSIPASPTTSR